MFIALKCGFFIVLSLLHCILRKTPSICFLKLYKQSSCLLLCIFIPVNNNIFYPSWLTFNQTTVLSHYASQFISIVSFLILVVLLSPLSPPHPTPPIRKSALLFIFWADRIHHVYSPQHPIYGRVSEWEFLLKKTLTKVFFDLYTRGKWAFRKMQLWKQVLNCLALNKK